mgnify:CR=1 FL=1
MTDRREAGAQRRADPKLLVVEREQRVQQRRAGARVAEPEERPRVDWVRGGAPAVEEVLDDREARVEAREERDEEDALPVAPPLDAAPPRDHELDPGEEADAAAPNQTSQSGAQEALLTNPLHAALDAFRARRDQARMEVEAIKEALLGMPEPRLLDIKSLK